MKAIFFKELIETTVRVLGLLILLGLALFPALTEQESTIVGRGMLTVGAFGFSIAAFLIGAIQVSQDWSLDRWSFLTHRPISRSRIFVAKVLAGLCLYFLAAGVPLLVAIFFVATPGLRQLPFTWSMTLPGIALWFHGFLWYFVAILVVTRGARWYATRIMPVGGAIVLSVIAIVLTLNFTEVYLVLAIGFLLLIPAAYGGFISAGILDRQPLTSRGLHILSVAGGALILVVGGAGLAENAINSVLYRLNGPTAQSYSTDSDGRVLLHVWDRQGTPTVTVIDGEPLPPQAPEHSGHPRYYEAHHDSLSFHDMRQRTISRGQMPQWDGASYLQRLQYGADPAWFYLPSDRRIHLVHLQSGRLAGTIGPSGFAQPPSRAEPFASDLVVKGGYPLVWDDTHVYEIDAERSSLRLVAELEANNRVLDAIVIRPPGRAEERPPGTVFVATSTGLQAWRDGKELLRASPVAATGEYWGVSITPTRKNTYMLLYNQSWVYGPPPVIAVELSAAGEVLRKIELPLLQYDAVSRPAWVGLIHGTVAPPIWTYTVITRWLTSANRLGVATPGMWIYPLTVIVSAATAVGLIFVLRRRLLLGRNETIGWSILTLVIGFSGVVTMLMIRGLPRRIKCPSCGKPRAINRDTCEHCGASHAPPQLTGIEIFE